MSSTAVTVLSWYRWFGSNWALIGSLPYRLIGLLLLYHSELYAVNSYPHLGLFGIIWDRKSMVPSPETNVRSS